VTATVAGAKGEAVVVLDFGSQYSQLIARRVRELNVYSELLPFDAPLERLRALAPRGLILSGGPDSVYAARSPRIGRHLLEFGVPVSASATGCSSWRTCSRGRSCRRPGASTGRPELDILEPAPLFDRTPARQQVWMSHGDDILEAPRGSS